MLNSTEIFETIKMIKNEHLDIRTITLGVSLFDCISDNAKRTATKCFDKIMKRAQKLTSVADTISKTYGVPIVSRRVSVSPISLIGASSGGFVEIANALDKAAKELDITYIGGYTALVQKGMTDMENMFLHTIPQVLSSTDRLCASVNVASTRAGINMDAVKLMGRIIKRTSEATADKSSIGCAKLVVFANAVEDNPFMAGAFNGVGEGDGIINVGISGPGVIKSALEKVSGEDLTAVSEVIKQTAFKITRVGQLVARDASKLLGATFGIVDLSLAPTPELGDSVAHILEEIGLESVGAHGTTACLALLNDAVKKGGVMASSHVGGLSGAFIPVSEDIGMIKAVERGALSIEKLEAMTAVCSVGLDMIAVSGDISPSTISAIIADEAAIGVINNKTTAVRLVPVAGKTEGYVEFGGILGRAPIIKIRDLSAEKFIN
ncbi:MAG: PFL family protein, partial [Clostridia bacterium]